RLGSCRVELRVGVLAIFQVALQALADQASGGGHAGGLLVAERSNESCAVDRRAECMPCRAPGVDARDSTCFEIESVPEGEADGSQEQLVLELRVGRVASRRRGSQALASIT